VGLAVALGAGAQPAPTYTATPLETLGGSRSQGNGINPRRQVVGGAYPVPGAQHAFPFKNGVMTDIGTSFDEGSNATDINELNPEASGVELIAAAAIDDLARIVGFGRYGGELVGLNCNGGLVQAAVLTPNGQQPIQDIIDLVGQVDLPQATKDRLLAKLGRAVRCADRGNPACACNSLGALINEVNAQAGKAITEEQAQLLLAAWQGLMATQGCR